MLDNLAGVITSYTGVDYTAGRSGNSIVITDGAGTAAITVAISGVGTPPAASAADIADPDADRTLNFTGVEASTGSIYRVTIGTNTFSYTATNSVLADILVGLAGAITNDPATNYVAGASGSILTITQGAGTQATLTVSGTKFLPTAGSNRVTITTTSAANHTFIHLTGIAVVNNAIYSLKINGTPFTFTADGTATLAEIATGLAGQVNASAYDATASSFTVANSWTSLLAGSRP